jgi:hypothetical protein
VVVGAEQRHAVDASRGLDRLDRIAGERQIEAFADAVYSHATRSLGRHSPPPSIFAVKPGCPRSRRKGQDGG